MLIHAATDNDIYPPRFGGSQRSFGLYRGLARRNQVHALCVVPNRSRGASRESAEGVGIVRRREWYTSAAWRLEQLGLAPLQIAARGHAARAARLLGALPGLPKVFAADLLLAGLIEKSPAPLKVYTSHNVERDRFAAGPGALHRSPRWRAWVAALEARAVGAATLTVACSDEDAARFQELYGIGRERLVVIPNGWDDARLQPATLERRGRARARLGIGESDSLVLFVGSDMPHNREAVRRLVDDVLPALAGRGMRLVVVGSVSRALAGAQGAALLVAGEVDDLEPWLHAADIGVNPMTSGAGSNVKLPTYLAAGLAVVTTRHGLRGYPELAAHVTVAEPAELAPALVARPRGWAARGLTMPEAIANLAWGRLGERLGETLTARADAAADAAAHDAPRPREVRA